MIHVSFGSIGELGLNIITRNTAVTISQYTALIVPTTFLRPLLSRL